MSQTLKILFFGDVIGKPGRRALVTYLKSKPEADLIIANVEDATTDSASKNNMLASSARQA